MLTKEKNGFRASATAAQATYGRRRGPMRNARVSRPDYPFTVKLPDGRTLAVGIPGRWTADDRDGSIVLLPEAARFIDRLQALATRTNPAPTPGYITSLREALGMTQSEFGRRIGVAGLTVSRWERGEVRPGGESVTAIEKLRRGQFAHGVLLAG